MNKPTPEELQAQFDVFKAEMNARMGAVEMMTKSKIENDRDKFDQVDKRFDRIEARLDRIEARMERLEEKMNALMNRVLSVGIATIVTIITAMTFILNYGSPSALMRATSRDAVTAPVVAPAPTSLPDTKPAKDHAEKVVR